jgi:hypothetical protein
MHISTSKQESTEGPKIGVGFIVFLHNEVMLCQNIFCSAATSEIKVSSGRNCSVDMAPVRIFQAICE